MFGKVQNYWKSKKFILQNDNFSMLRLEKLSNLQEKKSTFPTKASILFIKHKIELNFYSYWILNWRERSVFHYFWSVHTVTELQFSFTYWLLHTTVHKSILHYSGKILVCKQTMDQCGHKFVKICGAKWRKTKLWIFKEIFFSLVPCFFGAQGP